VEKLDYKIKGVEDEKNAGYDKERILRRRMGVKRKQGSFWALSLYFWLSCSL